jgi:hypothetical protein
MQKFAVLRLALCRLPIICKFAENRFAAAIRASIPASKGEGLQGPVLQWDDRTEAASGAVVSKQGKADERYPSGTA